MTVSRSRPARRRSQRDGLFPSISRRDSDVGLSRLSFIISRLPLDELFMPHDMKFRLLAMVKMHACGDIARARHCRLFLL